jgi:hypothetical protein
LWTVTVTPAPGWPAAPWVWRGCRDGWLWVLVTARCHPGAAGGDIDPTEGGAARVPRLLVADPAGQVHAELPVPPGGRGYRVQAAWPDRGQQWTLTTTATDPTPP